MALSRAIGDGAEQVGTIVADPDIFSYWHDESYQPLDDDDTATTTTTTTITDDDATHGDFIVVATDGLWDVLSSEDVISLVHGWLHQRHSANGTHIHDRNAIPALLVEEALRRHSDDNITVLILWLKK
jgi:serine/threonine protein phosphatase PrpC